MQTITHPQSGHTIQGILLGQGTKLRRTDRYASSTGDWEPGPSDSIELEPGCAALWVRPNIDLSEIAERLLTYLVDTKMYLVRKETGLSFTWFLNATRDSHTDPRLEFARIIRPAKVPEELLAVGYIVIAGEAVYEVTEVGELYAGRFLHR